MSEISPTFESVFTQEYWGELHQAGPTVKKGRVASSVISQMEALTARAAAGIFAGEPRQTIQPGSVIDRGGDSFHTLPGTVLLVDLEALFPMRTRPSEKVYAGDAKKLFHYQRYVHNEGDLVALPATMFMRNSRQWDGPEDEITVYPYRKSVVDPDLNAQYSRVVRLLAYGLDKSEKTSYRFLGSWDPAPGQKVRGTPNSFWEDISEDLMPPVEVGNSYSIPAERTIIRVKSAEICLSGTIEYAKAKKKTRRGLLAGRLAISRNVV